jgi:4-methyl-5(b-hydroxyethyl)-thiazole monophosphate biosynthesis
LERRPPVNKTAMIILADGFEEIEAVTPLDLLRRAHIEVSLCGLLSPEVTGSHNIVLKTERVLSSIPSFPDALVLPGGPGHKNLMGSALVIEFVKRMFGAGRLCAAICAAPLVFAKAGILANKKATCFPGDQDKLEGAVFVEQPVVVDENIITSRGAGTAVPFALEIISFLAGRAAADAVARSIVYGWT